jgi:chromosome segregation ATPase
MDQRQSDTPEVLRFAVRQKLHDESDPIDTVGHALVASLREAAKLSKENADRAMTVAHKLSIQLRAAEDRLKELEGEVEHLESRATRAEGWLQIIKNEIEDKLIGPIEANRPELPMLH